MTAQDNILSKLAALERLFDAKLSGIREEIRHLGEEFELRSAAIIKENKLAVDRQDERLNDLNHLHAAMKTQMEESVRKTQYDSDIKEVRKGLDSLNITRAEISGKASQWSVFFVGALGMISATVGVISLWRG